MDENRNCNQGLQFHISDYPVVLFTNPIQCLRRFERREGSEKNFSMTIRISGADIILDILCLSGHWIIHMAVHNLVKLQDVVSCQRNGIKAFVNNRKYIAVSRNFLLIFVPGSRFLLNQLPDSCIGGNNTLNGIGCLCTLNLCNLNQLL